MNCALMVPLWLCVIAVASAGCASVAVVKEDSRIKDQQYRALVVVDFENGVGNALPAQVQQKLPGAVVAHLNQCYPGAFDRVARTGHGSAGELLIRGTVLEFQAGNRALRFLAGAYGAGTAKFAADVAFCDGQTGQQLMVAKGDWVYKFGGIIGAIGGIDALVQTSGADIADLIAEKRGANRSEKQGCYKYGQPASR
jgi:hypothetical protein